MINNDKDFPKNDDIFGASKDPIIPEAKIIVGKIPAFISEVILLNRFSVLSAIQDGTKVVKP